jgi:hypothetical protein
MKYFAKINDQGVVIFVNGGKDSDDESAISEKTGDTYLETSITGAIRKNYAGIGYKYDTERDAFIPPQPYPSWLVDEDTCQWNAPVAYPDEVVNASGEGKRYHWDEDTMSWVEVD